MVVSCVHLSDDVAPFNKNSIIESEGLFLKSDYSGKESPLLVTLPNGLKVEKKDSLYYLDDMVFTEEGLKVLYESDRSACIDIASYYWPHREVYYKFNISVAPYQRHIYTAALNTIQNNTSLSFKYRNNNSGINNYIEFYKSSSGNNSYVGMQSGAQIINIEYEDSTTIMHETMHALGFFHEHCRADRDNYIIINTSNIKPAKMHNFNKYTVNYSGMDLGSFDDNSIMIYDSVIKDPEFVYDITIPTMYLIGGGTFTQGSTLSPLDIAGINSIYGPPFHRLERHRISIIEDSVNGATEQFITEDADSLVFYSDIECTTRQALQYPRRVRIKTTNRTGNGYNCTDEESYWEFTVPAGTKSCEIWYGYNYECYYNSYPSLSFNMRKNEIVNDHVPDASFNHTNNPYYYQF